MDSCFFFGSRGKGRLSSGRIDPSACHPSPHRLAHAPCAAPTRPARGMSGFWIRQVENEGVLRRWGGCFFHLPGPKNEEIPLISHLINPKNEELPPIASLLSAPPCRLAVRRLASTRPWYVCPGFQIRQVSGF